MLVLALLGLAKPEESRNSGEGAINAQVRKGLVQALAIQACPAPGT